MKITNTRTQKHIAALTILLLSTTVAIPTTSALISDGDECKDAAYQSACYNQGGNCNNWGDMSVYNNIGSDCSSQNTIYYCNTAAGSGQASVGVAAGAKTDSDASGSAQAGGGCENGEESDGGALGQYFQ